MDTTTVLGLILGVLSTIVTAVGAILGVLWKELLRLKEAHLDCEIRHATLVTLVSELKKDISDLKGVLANYTNKIGATTKQQETED